MTRNRSPPVKLEPGVVDATQCFLAPPGAQSLFFFFFFKKRRAKKTKHLLSEDLWKPCEPNEREKKFWRFHFLIVSPSCVFMT